MWRAGDERVSARGLGGDQSPSMCRAASAGCQRYHSQGLAGGWGPHPAPEGSQHGAALLRGGAGSHPAGTGVMPPGQDRRHPQSSTNPAGSSGSGSAAASEAGFDLEAIVGSRRCRETTCPCVYCGGRRAATCRRDGASTAGGAPRSPPGRKLHPEPPLCGAGGAPGKGQRGSHGGRGAARGWRAGGV